MALSLTGLFVFLVCMLAFSWHRWPDVLFDYGYQLYYPWRLASGEVLYRDLITNYGPFSFYINSLIFRSFGVHLISLIYFDLLIIFLLAWLIYRIFSFAVGRYAAFLATSTFMVLFAFSHTRIIGNYNYVCPYSHEMVHGIFLSFLTIELFTAYLRDGRSSRWAVIGLLLGCIFLTKVEIFLPLLISLLASHAALLYFNVTKRRKTVKDLGLMFLAFPLIPVFFMGLLSSGMPARQALEGIFRQYLFLADPHMQTLPFYRKVFGIDHLFNNLTLMGVAMLVWAAVCALLFFLAKNFSVKAEDRSLRISAFFISAVVAVFIISRHDVVEKFILIDLFRPLPLAMFVLSIYWARKLGRMKADTEYLSKKLPFFGLTLFSLFLLIKMFFCTHLFHIGFVLAMPATLVFFTFLFEEVPGWARLGPPETLRWRDGVIAVLIVIFCFYSAASIDLYRRKSLMISSNGELLYDYGPAFSGRGQIIQETLEYLNASLKPDDTLAVLPEGTIFNYLTRHRNPSRFVYWTPTEERSYDERLTAEELEASEPDLVLLVDRDATEHGARYFGRDYGKKIFEWVMRDYKAVRTIGEEPFSGHGFGITVYKRLSQRDSPSSNDLGR